MGEDIRKLWERIWEKLIKDQPIWMKLCFYNLVGALLKDVKYRVNVWFFSDSGSGKGAGGNLVKDVLDECGIKTASPGELTDAALLGSINSEAVKHNRRFGLTPERRTIVKRNKKEEIYQEPTIKGILFTKDWCIFEEAEIIIHPRKHSENIQVILRQALDRKGYVEKSLKDGTMKCYTHTSFLFLSQCIPNIDSVILNGLLPRALVYSKRIKPHESRNIENHIIDAEMNEDNPYQVFGLGVEKKHRYNYVNFPEFKLLVKKLKEVKNKYSSTHPIQFPKALKEYMKNKRNNLVKFYKSQDETTKYILDPVLRRGIQHIITLAKISAIADERNKVEEKDIDEIFDIFENCFDSLIEVIIKMPKEKRIQIVILEILKNKEMSTMQLYNKVRELTGKSHPSIQKVLKVLEKDKRIRIEQHGNTRLIKLNNNFKAV